MKVESSKNQFDMQDPTTQYPAPKFPKQTQGVPGLARQVEDPKPELGKKARRAWDASRGEKP